ncbi:TPA: SDR family NAD(P)-dependent oxidoreductase [Salmonella enterica subsp. houtenae serovar [1],40:z4,z23:-]
MSQPWILVTGGSRGIGRELVLSLSERWRVVFTWKNNATAASEVVDHCRRQGCLVEAIQCDGASEEQVHQTATRLLEQYGAPYGIVHNAGVPMDALHIHQTAECWRKVMDTNLHALFYWHQSLLPAMFEAKSGSIVFITSVSGAVRGNAGQTAYSASKAAMVGLCRSLALETGRFGIRVNCIAPGVIDSELLNTIPADKLNAFSRQIPLRRISQPADVASSVRFFLNEESQWITGQCLVVDGGMSV